MAVEIQMPSLGLSIPEGTVERWLKKEGDRVEKGDLLVVIMTEKVTVDLPAEASGVLLKILCPAGTKVKVGEVIAVIGEAGESTETIPKVSQASPPSSAKALSAHPSHKERGDFRISPLAMRIAAEHGVDIREVAAGFPGRKIGKDEVLAFIEKGKSGKRRPRPPGKNGGRRRGSQTIKRTASGHG